MGYLGRFFDSTGVSLGELDFVLRGFVGSILFDATFFFYSVLVRGVACVVLWRCWGLLSACDNVLTAVVSPSAGCCS